jgi:hypothetical protein
MGLHGRGLAATANAEEKAMTTTTKFYCNSKALNPTERAHHKELTDKLIATRKEIVETDKGYEFQYNPATVSLAELADWVVAEGKCCPFFDFYIDLEREGSLLCLRLTGEEGSSRSSGQSFRYRLNNSWAESGSLSVLVRLMIRRSERGSEYGNFREGDLSVR